jgi:hypothetical protein
MNKKLDRVSFMWEPGRNLFIYDSMVRDPLTWSKLRRNKRSFLTGAKVTMICQSVGQAGQDTLNTVKDIYLTYRTERHPDPLSEDIESAIAPGVTGDSPKNDFLDAAWRSLKALGNKHGGPNIGRVQMNKSDLLQQVYTRGTWDRTPDHHAVFTYQVVPRQGGGRKRMK